MTTRLDVSSLAGDPTATQTLDEWAQDLYRAMTTMAPRRARQVYNEMTDDEREAFDGFRHLVTAELLARLDWLGANVDTVVPSPLAA